MPAGPSLSIKSALKPAAQAQAQAQAQAHPAWPKVQEERQALLKLHVQLQQQAERLAQERAAFKAQQVNSNLSCSLHGPHTGPAQDQQTQALIQSPLSYLLCSCAAVPDGPLG